ncbi:hypothetical protein [Nostoc sp.]|uniref:hypothetical protein n=1 Tax=Nostoc sp. TaxID=1180 RepID=UPI002FFCC899
MQKSPLPVEIILCASSQDGISKAIAFIISAIAQSLLAKGQSWLVLAASRWQAQFNVSVFVDNFLQSQISF